MTRSTNFLDHTVRVVDALEPELLPVGRRLRLTVDMVRDGLGRAQRIPLVCLRGKHEGPVFGLTCALHGNELNGIPVVHKLMDTLDPKQLRGTVVIAPVLNIPGFVSHQRVFRDGADLNHIMPGVADGDESHVWAHRLLDRIVSRFDYLVDLHTASFGRVNTLYVRTNMRDPRTARMAYLQRPHIILHNPPSDHTLRGAAAERGIAAITVEVGDPQVFQAKHIRQTLAGVRALLADLRMIPKRPVAVGSVPYICGSSRWVYTSHGGLLEVLPDIGTPVSAGEVVARQTDIFGDLVAEYPAPFGGVVIGKSMNPVSPTGARIMHLGRIATPEDGLLSEEAILGAT